MAYLDNPAGRLSDLLTRLGEQPPQTPILSAWAAVLQVERIDIDLHLGKVAELPRQIQTAATDLKEEAVLIQVGEFLAVWSRPMFPEDVALTAEVHLVVPGAASMNALNMLSAHLHSVAPEGKVPGGEELANVRHKLHELIEQIVRADEQDIPAEVKRVMVSRLRGVLEAVDDLGIGGPEAIRRAMESAIGSIAYADDPQKIARNPVIGNVAATLILMWSVFSSGPQVQQSLEAWREILNIPARTAGSEGPTASPELPADK